MKTLPEDRVYNFEVHSTPRILWLITEDLTTGVTEWYPVK